MFSVDDTKTDDDTINVVFTGLSEEHTHEITDVNNLESRLEAIEQSIQDLTNLVNNYLNLG